MDSCKAPMSFQGQIPFRRGRLRHWQCKGPLCGMTLGFEWHVFGKDKILLPAGEKWHGCSPARLMVHHMQRVWVVGMCTTTGQDWQFSPGLFGNSIESATKVHILDFFMGESSRTAKQLRKVCHIVICRHCKGMWKTRKDVMCWYLLQRSPFVGRQPKVRERTCAWPQALSRSLNRCSDMCCLF